ncbi:MAG: hypothetical protein NTX00_01935 [Candidatus Parcubacteria bacterium]|nr:hypothetical protein [Candidatus Parcubacteria bacterium]
MKGIESMPEQKTSKSEERIAREKLMVGGGEALELGKQIDAELKAAEELKEFYKTPVWVAWEEAKQSFNPEVKEPARDKVMARLNEIQGIIDKRNERDQKALGILREEIEKDMAHA